MAVIKPASQTPVKPTTTRSTDAHDALVVQAERWLRRQGCLVTIRDELRVYTLSGEQPDAIGWRDGLSILIECKVTRSDFLADAKKTFRAPDRGMGDWRFYLCPPAVIQPEDLPEGWGLLWTKARGGVEECHGVPGNCGWWNDRPFEGDKHNETLILASALRRFARAGMLDQMYER